jgi:hypothetical protein
MYGKAEGFIERLKKNAVAGFVEAQFFFFVLPLA